MQLRLSRPQVGWSLAMPREQIPGKLVGNGGTAPHLRHRARCRSEAAQIEDKAAVQGRATTKSGTIPARAMAALTS